MAQQQQYKRQVWLQILVVVATMVLLRLMALECTPVNLPVVSTLACAAASILAQPVPARAMWTCSTLVVC
jgi:hypothetical protein